MRGSFPLGRLLGIPLRVHATFPLLLVLIAVWVGFADGPREAAYATLTLLLLFACVLLHELGHSVVSVKLGHPVRDITLLPIGGVARMERSPTDPAEELLITAAGPLVSFGIALALAGLMLAGVAEARLPDFTSPYLVSNLCWLNVAVGLFNLVPAFPMDGGRVVRALLAMVLGRVVATRIATGLGRLLAALMVAAGILLLNPFLVLIAVLVWVWAGLEGRSVAVEEALARIPAGAAAVRRFVLLGEDERLGEAERVAREGFQQDFPVLARGAGLLGILDRRALEAGLRSFGPEGRAGQAVAPAVTGREGDSLSELYRRMLAAGREAAVLLDAGGRPAGLVTADQVRRVLLFGRSGATARAEARSGGEGAAAGAVRRGPPE